MRRDDAGYDRWFEPLGPRCFRAAILQRFSPDNKSFDRPGTASMRHTSKASGGILSSLREMNDSTSCYHAMTAVCHGCTAIDEILQSWLYIHHRRTAIDEVLLSWTYIRHRCTAIMDIPETNVQTLFCLWINNPYSSAFARKGRCRKIDLHDSARKLAALCSGARCAGRGLRRSAMEHRRAARA